MSYSYRVVLIAGVAMLARVASSQEPSVAAPPGAVVTGVVFDSITRRPLAGATVQLALTDSLARRARSAVTDAQGRFRVEDVADGIYMIGFFHPMLDSLAMEPMLHEVRVANHASVRVALGIPSPRRMRQAICGPRSDGDVGAAIIGVVRDARTGAPIADANVTAEWNEVAFTSRGPVARTPTRVSMSAENGFFALCDLPPLGTMSLLAGRGADSATAIEVTLPGDRFVRQDLWLESAPFRAARLAAARHPD